MPALCSRSNGRTPAYAWAKSSAERRATRTLPHALAARFASASRTDALDTSVATTRRKLGASAAVKQPLPQYSSQRSVAPKPRAVASWAQPSIFSHTRALGCEKAPSCCVNWRAPSPGTCSVSVTNSPPTTSFTFLERPTRRTPSAVERSVAAAAHASPMGRLYVSVTSASPVDVVRKRTSFTFSRSAGVASRASRSGVMRALMRCEPIGKDVTSRGVRASSRLNMT
mmetsp:Transcript_45533/g.106276  ORF Transcript_45533/g.106276 Transcript_45533/m.106276 type:complete len:227 (+) Transcript_45533:235-915(+)